MAERDDEDLIREGESFYRKLRSRMATWISGKGKSNKWADVLMLAPDLFYTMLCLLKDDRVSARQKAKLVGAIVYFISPVDLIPEGVVGPVGYIDDIALAAYVLDQMINGTDEQAVRDCWPGTDEDVLAVLKKVLAVAGKLPAGVWSRLTQMGKGK